MADVGKVMEFPDRDGNRACERCGSEWFTVVVALSSKGYISGHLMTASCQECGHPTDIEYLLPPQPGEERD